MPPKSDNAPESIVHFVPQESRHKYVENKKRKKEETKNRPRTAVSLPKRTKSFAFVGRDCVRRRRRKKRLHLHIAELVTSGRAVGDAPVLGTLVFRFSWCST